MADKKTFIMYKSWSGAIEKMTDEQAGQLLKAIYAVENGGTADPADPTLGLLWPVIKEKLEEDSDNYDAMLEQRKEAGRRGNEKRWGTSRESQAGELVSQKSQPRQARSQTSQPREIESRESQPREIKSRNIANVAESVSESDTESESDKDTPLNPPYGEIAGAGIDLDGIKARFDDPEMGQAFIDWLQVRTAMPPFPYMAMAGAISDAKSAEEKYGPERCIPLIKKARSGAWKAIPWDNLEEKPRSGTTKPQWGAQEQHDYDWGALEKALEA